MTPARRKKSEGTLCTSVAGVEAGRNGRPRQCPGAALPIVYCDERLKDCALAERRVDRIERCLRALGGRARLQQLLEEIRDEEGKPDVSYQSVYIAIQLENQRLDELGERTRFITSRDGEERGWIRLREKSDLAPAARDLEEQIKDKNESVGGDIRTWLQGMDWRTFESTFLTRVLEALGFQDVRITQATRDGGTDARVTYRRGIVEALAIVSAKRWTTTTVGVEEVRMLRGLPGNEDTAIVVTTGKFSADAQKESKPSQNQRAVYLIDGEQLVEICKRNQIGVKKVQLPDLLVLDPEVTREPGAGEDTDEAPSESVCVPAEDDISGPRRLRDEMLGDSVRGLSVEEVAKLSQYAVNTVRAYLSDPQERKKLGKAIREDEQARRRALEIVSERRGLKDNQ